MRKPKSNLKLNNRKRGNTVKEFKPSCKWTDSFQEIVGTLCSRTIPYVPKPLQRRTFSPSFKCSKLVSPLKLNKRNYSKTPTPQKKVSALNNSPYAKKVKRSSSKALFTGNTSDINIVHEFQYIENNERTDIDEDKSQTDLKLENPTEQCDTMSELTSMLPTVLENLSAYGHDETVLNFFKQINQKKFPMTNIAFLLWTEVVKWYSLDNTSFMRYSDDTKKFWKLGYRIFGGRFVHFMTGYKNASDTDNRGAKKGIFSPNKSDINFAVPDVDVLRRYRPYDNLDDTVTRDPGIFHDMIDVLSRSTKEKSFCLTFDGKKLKQGLTKESGDVDMLGFEKDATLAEKREKRDKLIDPVVELISEISNESGDSDVNSLDEAVIKQMKDLLMTVLKHISEEILDIQDLRKKKDYAKEKLIERSGKENWKNGKYVYAISSMIAFLHDIDKFLEESLNIVDELIQCICCMNGQTIVTEKCANLLLSQKYCSIEETNQQVTVAAPTRRTKQRSDEWMRARRKARVTGSTFYGALGLDGLKKQKDHFDNVVCGAPEKEKSETLKNALKYGTENESSAAVTFAEKVLPLLFPNAILHEEGYIEIGQFNNDPFMIVSPDGSVRTSKEEISTIAAVEYKCPLQQIHKSMPERYLLQCLSEIEALDVPELIYVCWRPQFSTIFRVNRNTSLFNKAFDHAKELYGRMSPKRQTSLSEESKQLKSEIEAECKSAASIQFVGVVPSLRHSNNATCSYRTEEFCIRRMKLLLENIVDVYKTYYDLRRQPASEAIVFLVCDLDREWKEDGLRSAPVCWFPKGYSLDTNTMRGILEKVLISCHEAGIHIPAISFDGQWHNLCVRNEENKPLTKFQLQKDVWKKTEIMSKTEIIDTLKGINRNPKWRVTTKNMNNLDGVTANNQYVVIETTDEERVPNISSRVALLRIKDRSKVQGVKLKELSNTNKVNDNEDMPEINGQNNTQGHETKNISEDDAGIILQMLKSDKKSNNKGQWNNKGAIEIEEILRSYQQLSRLRDVELRIIVRYLNKLNIPKKLKESDSKQSKINEISSVLNLNIQTEKEASAKHPKPKKKNNVKSLSELALHEVSRSLRKSDLNIIMAEYKWPDELKKWQSYIRLELKKAYPNETKRDDVDESNANWFYTPNYSKMRNQLEVSCIDSTHLLTRTRRKCCKGGLDGLSNTPWRKVSKSNSTNLSLAMVDAIFEPMSVSVAVTHFSESVEKCMRENNDIHAADLCKDIRTWWESEDNAGIPAYDRIRLRQALRNRLVNYVNFGHFPPPGMFVNGWPCQLWEGLIANIDAKEILYNLAKTNTYNVRAFSSMMGETFFSELCLHDKRGQGTVSTDEFGQYISSTVEKLQMRLDPKRVFSYRTSRKHVYNLVERASSDEKSNVTLKDEQTSTVRNHAFDQKTERYRPKPKKKEGHIQSDRNSVKRGSLGVRWETARRNEGKLLPTLRLGIELE